jgi:hypothetical protein
MHVGATLGSILALAAAGCSFDSSASGLGDGPADAAVGVPGDATPVHDAPSGAGDAPVADADAMAAIDAAEKPFVIIETLSVPVDGSSIQSTVTLRAGEGYRLRALGTCVIAPNGLRADAEYFFFDGDDDVMDASQKYDMGLAIDDAVVDLDKQPKWGPFVGSHVYEIPFAGTGAPIAASFHDLRPGNNVGSLTVEILARE